MSEADHPFYLLKKDSERRKTLVQVLSSDSSAIIDEWMSELRKSSRDPLILSEAHLGLLLQGIKDFIPNNDKSTIDQSIATIKEELEYDSAVVPQLQSALLQHAQNAISSILKLHNIKPHWIFALDSLIRAAVQAAITVLSPELGQNLAGADSGYEPESPSTGGDMTPILPSSQKSHLSRPYEKVSPTLPIDGPDDSDLREKYKRVKAENHELLEELVRQEERMNFVLKACLENSKLQISFLQSRWMTAPIVGPFRANHINPPQIIVEGSSAASTPSGVGGDLQSWASSIFPTSPDIVNRIMNNYTSLSDIMSAPREDIHKLSLRQSDEQLLYTEIVQLRQRMTHPLTNHLNHSGHNGDDHSEI